MADAVGSEPQHSQPRPEHAHRGARRLRQRSLQTSWCTRWPSSWASTTRVWPSASESVEYPFSPRAYRRRRCGRSGPSPATMAFAAEVFSPINSSRSSRTATPAWAAVWVRASASGPGSSGRLRRKIGSSTTGQAAASTSPNPTASEPRRQRPAVRPLPLAGEQAERRQRADHVGHRHAFEPVAKPPRRGLPRQPVAAGQPVARPSRTAATGAAAPPPAPPGIPTRRELPAAA